jgi:hypothetical protein
MAAARLLGLAWLAGEALAIGFRGSGLTQPALG